MNPVRTTTLTFSCVTRLEEPKYRADVRNHPLRHGRRRAGEPAAPAAGQDIVYRIRLCVFICKTESEARVDTSKKEYI